MPADWSQGFPLALSLTLSRLALRDDAGAAGDLQQAVSLTKNLPTSFGGLGRGVGEVQRDWAD